MKRPCLTCGCLIPLGSGSRCLEHRRAVQRARDAVRATPAQRGYTGEYQRNRTAVLAASDGWCTWCHRWPATTVDHVVPLAKGGTNDPDNLVPACKPCNYSRGSRDAPSWGALHGR